MPKKRTARPKSKKTAVKAKAARKSSARQPKVALAWRWQRPS